MMTEYNSTTTLNAIRAASPCEDGWMQLLRHLGKTKADDEPLSLLTVLNSNGLDDALWVLSYAMPDDRLARHFQAWCATQVIHIFEAVHTNDHRVRDQIAMLRNDTATDDQRAAAMDAAGAAAWDAAMDAAWTAAGGAAGAAAGAAAWTAAGDAASAAAWDAAWDTARGAAGAAAMDAARAAAWDAQEVQLRKMIGGE